MSNTPTGPERLGRYMAMAAWVIVLGIAWLLFNDVLEDQSRPNRGLRIDASVRELVLERNRQGHYVAPGFINGTPVELLLDTGATGISVPRRLAERIGLVPGGRALVSTANGVVEVRATTIDELRLGPFTYAGLRGHINPGQEDELVLVGMSVLQRLDFRQSDGNLVLRARAD